jgi:predicted RND superfamily exporter protein
MVLYAAQNDYIVSGKVLSIILALCLVFVFCSVVFRSTVAGILCLLPVSLATLLVFGVMGFAGIRLDLSSGLLTAIVVGVGADFSIHLLSRIRDLTRSGIEIPAAVSQSVLEGGRPIVYDCLSNLSFLVFVGSAFEPTRDLGWLLGLSMVASMIGSLVLLSALVRGLQPRFLSRAALVTKVAEAPR